MPIWTKLLINGISLIAWVIPNRVKFMWAQVVTWIAFDLFKFRRYTLIKNIQIAFPEWTKEQKYSFLRRSLVYTVYNFAEFLMLPLMSKDWVEENVIFEGVENYYKAKEQGHGVLLLSLHMGNGDMAISVITLKGLDIHLISKKFSNKLANALWFGVREGKGGKFIDPHGTKTAFDILGACRKNEGVIFVIDQFMGKPYGIENTFFGKKTGTAYGLALFAIKTKAPVLPLYTYRDEKLRTHLVIGEPVPLEDIKDRDLQIQTMTQKYTDKVEEIIRKIPEQWMWVHRRWKKWK